MVLQGWAKKTLLAWGKKHRIENLKKSTNKYFCIRSDGNIEQRDADNTKIHDVPSTIEIFKFYFPGRFKQLYFNVDISNT